MKLLKYYPYFIAIIISIIFIYHFTEGGTSIFGTNFNLLIVSTLLFTLLIARFFHLNYQHSFIIAAAFFLFGISFLYFVISHPYYTLRGFGYPVYFVFCILGIVMGYLVERQLLMKKISWILIVLALSGLYITVPLDAKFSIFEPVFKDIFYEVYDENRFHLDEYPVIYVSHPEMSKIELPKNVQFVNSEAEKYPYLTIHKEEKDITRYTFMLTKETDWVLPLKTLEVKRLQFGWNKKLFQWVFNLIRQ